VAPIGPVRIAKRHHNFINLCLTCAGDRPAVTEAKASSSMKNSVHHANNLAGACFISILFLVFALALDRAFPTPSTIYVVMLLCALGGASLGGWAWLSIETLRRSDTMAGALLLSVVFLVITFAMDRVSPSPVTRYVVAVFCASGLAALGGWTWLSAKAVTLKF
jgi:hypothetical protein